MNDDYIMGYFDRIKNAKSRFEAADLILAWSAYIASKAYFHNPEDRLSIIEEATRQAENLVMDFSFDPDDGTLVSEEKHPWRSWLKEWGF